MICKEDYENTKSAIDVIAKAKGDRRDLAKFEALVCEAGFGFSGCSFQKHAQRLLDILEYAEHKNDDRLMPKGMTWPRFEDGEPVLVGDEFETMASGIKKVDAIKFEDGYIFSLEFNNGCGTAKFYKNARVKRPEHRETLQDVIDDLYKQVPNQEFGHIIRVPIDLIDRLEAIQKRMGGDSNE